MDPLKPEPSLLCKLGSIARHVEEVTENGHAFDVLAIKGLLGAEDVREWMAAMDGMALLPVKREVPDAH